MAPAFSLRPTRTFIVEGDEYDTAFFDKGPKFLHYFPDALILTHVEFDHADIYADLEAVKTAFKRLVNLVPRRGVIVAYDGSANVTECVSRALLSRRAVWIQCRGGLAHPESAHRERPLALGDLAQRRAVGRDGDASSRRAQRAECYSRGGASLRTGHETKKRSELRWQSFKSVKRRLEVRAEINGVTIIDDFAHHPTAIRETLRALRAVYPHARLWAVLEPRSNTLRRKVLASDLIASLRLADRVVLSGVYQQQRIAENERLYPEEVIAALNAEGTRAELFPDVEAIINGIAPELRPGDVVAILSNGGFDGIYEKLPARLSESSR